MSEVWKPVLGYEDRYMVSDQGRVFSMFSSHPRSGCILQPKKKARGYLTVTLYKDGRKREAQIHALVCEAFHGPKPEGNETLHRNGKSNDNRADNLRWGTHKENAEDAIKHDVILIGDSHPLTKISDVQVLEIRTLAKESNLTLKQIGSRYGIGKSYTWKLVSGYRRRRMHDTDRNQTRISSAG